MSESPQPAPEPAAAPLRALNRWSIGSLSALQLLFLLAALVALNILALRHYQRIDLSRDGNYSLAPATQRYLASPAMADRAETVKWILCHRRVSPFYERVRAIAEEYARQSGGKIILEIVDPLRSPDRTQQVMAAYGLSLVRDMLIMDARTDDSPAVVEGEGGIRALHPQVRVALAEEMVLHTVDPRGQRRPSAFRAEDVLTARLVEALEGKPRRILFLADKSRIEGGDERSPWNALESTLRFQNIELSPTRLAGMAEIPQDIEGVAIIAPKYDFTDAEIATLERYWSRPRAAILLLLQQGECPPKLRAFLRDHGVTPRRDRLITREGETLRTSVGAFFTPGIEFTADLAGQTTVFDGASASLEVREDAGDLEERRIFPLPLAEAAAGFWGETRFGSGEEAFDEREDHSAPLYLAAAVIRGAAADDRFAGETARLVVVTNTGFLETENQRAENIDFLTSSVNWLVQRDSLAGIGPRTLGNYRLPLLDSQIAFLNRINWFFLPGFLLVAGGFVWSSRRA